MGNPTNLDHSGDPIDLTGQILPDDLANDDSLVRWKTLIVDNLPDLIRAAKRFRQSRFGPDEIINESYLALRKEALSGVFDTWSDSRVVSHFIGRFRYVVLELSRKKRGRVNPKDPNPRPHPKRADPISGGKTNSVTKTRSAVAGLLDKSATTGGN